MKQPWALPWTSGSPRPAHRRPAGTRAASGPWRTIRFTGSPDRIKVRLNSQSAFEPLLGRDPLSSQWLVEFTTDGK